MLRSDLGILEAFGFGVAFRIEPGVLDLMQDPFPVAEIGVPIADLVLPVGAIVVGMLSPGIAICVLLDESPDFTCSP